MVTSRAESGPNPILTAALVALLLTMRLLTPAGFMPAFANGALTIVACPDAEPAPPSHMGHHSGGHSKKQHQPCPYASGSALGALPTAAPPQFTVLIAGPPLLLGRASVFVDRSNGRLRPPLRGPPLPA